MNSDELDENMECKFPTWNNWDIPRKKKSGGKTQNEYSEPNIEMYKKSLKPLSAPVSECFGNWIPPLNFGHRRNDLNLSQSKDIKENDESVIDLEVNDISVNEPNNSDKAISLSAKESLRWECRKNLHDGNFLTENGIIWNVIDPGIFAQIKLWLNEYDNICGSAKGKVSKVGCHEEAVIMIDNTENLRKLLNVSKDEWASLCEAVKQKKLILKYDAYTNYDLTKMTSFDKLWFFLCKRRHFLPGICVSVRLNGAVKLMKEFNILPKLTVQGVYDLNHVEIS